MKKYGLLGHNINYSLSPKMHNAAFKALDIEAHYELFDMEEADVKIFLERLISNQISGINITVPYKEISYAFVKANGVIDAYADKVGAINTIVVEDNTLYGYNTDGSGFMRSVSEDLVFDVRDKKVVLIGAGGAAKACAVKLLEKCSMLAVIDIDIQKSEALVLNLNNIFNKQGAVVCKTEDQKTIAIKECEMIVNATACGRDGKTSPVDLSLLEKCQAAYDVIYDPVRTPLLAGVQEKGAKIANGLGMLLYQGADAFSLWTKQEAPIEIMRKALV